MLELSFMANNFLKIRKTAKKGNQYGIYYINYSNVFWCRNET